MSGPVRCIVLALSCFVTAMIAAPSLIAAQALLLPMDLELILAVDVSGSVDEEEAQLQR